MYLYIILSNYSDLASLAEGNTSPCTKISLNSSLSITCWSNNDVNAVISCPINLSISKSLLIFTSGGSIPTYSADKDYKQVESGNFSLGEIPLVTIYSGKTDNLVSKPPLLDIAYLNLAHFQRQADLIHSLHVASQPMLVMEGYDDQTKDLAISVNYAMATQPGNKVYYVEPASSAFDAQSAEIKELQMQMATLGISTLSQQKFVAESADARRLDRVDTNSMLAMVSMELEQKLQKAFNLSAEYVGIEPPEVKISRDFDIERLIGQDITALTSLFDQQVIDREEFRDILVQGEVLPSGNEAKSE